MSDLHVTKALLESALPRLEVIALTSREHEAINGANSAILRINQALDSINFVIKADEYPSASVTPLYPA